jgi:hypothetical protein
MLERRMAWYALDREQAQHMARGAAELGLLEMHNHRFVLAFDRQVGYTGLDQRWAQPIDLFQEGYFVDSGDEFEDDVCEVAFGDLDRYISLYFAPPDLLESVKGLSASTLSEILKRREPSTPGYQPSLFHVVDELRQVQSFSDEQWFGTQERPGLKGVLSTWGEAINGRININTAPIIVLEQVPDIDSELVEAVMQYRNGPDGQSYTWDDRAFTHLGEVSQRIDISAEKLSSVNNYCKTHSRFFTITGHASRRRGMIQAYCTITVDLQGGKAKVVAWREDTGGA